MPDCKNMIKAIVIDDELISLKALSEKIKAHCPEVEVLQLFDRPEHALEKIGELDPDVVFLDIEMPKMNGFTFLKKIQHIKFEVIFTTAYNEYAIDALRISALDFLTKPINVKELSAAIERLKLKLKSKSLQNRNFEEQLEIFFQYQHPAVQLGKIALPILNGLEMVNVDDIIKIKGENVYSIFHFLNGKKLVVSLTLKQVENMLSRGDFYRVHKSFIVNLKYMTRYVNGKGGTVVLADGSEVEVSRRNKADFLKRITS